MIVHRRPRVRGLITVLAAITASLAFGVSAASAARTDPPGHQDANHCLNGSGIDLNELYGISDQFRTRECQEVTAGEHWIRPVWWIVNFGIDSIYPAGYVPSRPEPIDDFLAKLVVIKVVIDGGTPQERTHFFAPGKVTRTDIHAEQLDPGAWGASFPMASLLPRLPPLSVGDHTQQLFLVLSAQHCDGFSDVVEENCLPAGEFDFGPPRPLIVTTPAD